MSLGIKASVSPRQSPCKGTGDGGGGGLEYTNEHHIFNGIKTFFVYKHVPSRALNSLYENITLKDKKKY